MHNPLMERSKKGALPHNVLQEYLETLADMEGPPQARLHKALESYAEVQFRMRGGSHCAICHAAVRHVLPVRAEHTDGTVGEFACLCTRCLHAERVLSNKVTVTVGHSVLEYGRKDEPKTHKFAAR